MARKGEEMFITHSTFTVQPYSLITRCDSPILVNSSDVTAVILMHVTMKRVFIKLVGGRGGQRGRKEETISYKL